MNAICPPPEILSPSNRSQVMQLARWMYADWEGELSWGDSIRYAWRVKRGEEIDLFFSWDCQEEDQETTKEEPKQVNVTVNLTVNVNGPVIVGNTANIKSVTEAYERFLQGAARSLADEVARSI